MQSQLRHVGLGLHDETGGCQVDAIILAQHCSHWHHMRQLSMTTVHSTSRAKKFYDLTYNLTPTFRAKICLKFSDLYASILQYLMNSMQQYKQKLERSQNFGLQLLINNDLVLFRFF